MFIEFGLSGLFLLLPALAAAALRAKARPVPVRLGPSLGRRGAHRDDTRAGGAVPARPASCYDAGR